MSFLTRPITVLKMGQRQHEALLAGVHDTVKAVMEAHKWTCHKCGVRAQGYMQIDHLRTHADQDIKNLRPICSFCHDQDHVIWSAARKRVVPIIAPDLTNEHISRIAWAMMALRVREDNDNARGAIENVTAAFRQRHHDFQQKYGSGDADSIIEATFRFLMKEEEETEAETARKKAIAENLVSETRFIPKILSGSVISDVSESVSVWTVGGFAEPAKTPADAIGLDHDPDLIISAVAALFAETQE